MEARQFLIANNEPTVIDIIYYNEISAAIMLTRIKGFKRLYPRISKWINMMGEITELAEYDEKLVEVIDKYELE